MSGELNGESIIGQDLNCYVVTEDGRTYTAISRLGEGLGWQLQAAVPLGTVISWLFARPEGGGQNGFSITGGVLNYTAEVTYPETGDRLSILFQFKVKRENKDISLITCQGLGCFRSPDSRC